MKAKENDKSYTPDMCIAILEALDGFGTDKITDLRSDI